MTAVLRDLIGLDRSDRRRVAERLTTRVRDLIRDGRLSAGTKLPSSRVLAHDLGLARNTVATAMDQLSAEGYLLIRRGRCPKVAIGPMDIGRMGRPRKAPVPPTSVRRAEPSLPRVAPWPSFRACLADAEAFPHDQWALCLRDAVRRTPRGAGIGNRSALHAALCEHLAEFRGVRAEPEQIVVVPTAQAALSLVAHTLLAPGEHAWMEEPGYPGMRAALTTAGAAITPAAIDEHGLAVLPGPVPKLIFVTPSHHYPTGRLMPVGRRHALLAAAARHGAVIVEDDYDGEFHYDGAPVPALQGLDEHGSVIYVGTFTKAMTPDIRVGYLIVPRPLLTTVEEAQRQWGMVVSPHVQEALGLFLRRGVYRAHIRKMRRVYRSRRDTLVAALQAQGSDIFQVERPPGGLQLVAALRRDGDDTAVATAASACGLDAAPLSSFFIGPPTMRGLLIGFAALRAEDFDASVATLCDLTRRSA